VSLLKCCLLLNPKFIQKEFTLSRKSPAPKSKPSNELSPKDNGMPEQRVRFLLNYISSINRQTLAALYQLYAAPDCQVGEVPALRSFEHKFAETGFCATAFVTWPQSVALKNAAEQSIDALRVEAFRIAITLRKGVAAAEQSLVAALLAVPITTTGVLPHDDPPPPPPPPIPTGCCYYNNSPPMPDCPQDLCLQDPDYYSWAQGSPCVVP
jgi:hypothetical protein